MTVLACVLLSCHLINENDDDDDDDGWPSIIGGDAGDPGGPAAALCKLAMEWVCQVGGKDKATVDSKHGISLWFFCQRISKLSTNYLNHQMTPYLIQSQIIQIMCYVRFSLHPRIPDTICANSIMD